MPGAHTMAPTTPDPVIAAAIRKLDDAPRVKRPTRGCVFEIDLNATQFNVCAKCHRHKSRHELFDRTSGELAVKLGERKRSALRAADSGSRAPKPCDRFRRDLDATSFQTCECGWPSADHDRFDASSGANEELASRLRTRPAADVVIPETVTDVHARQLLSAVPQTESAAAAQAQAQGSCAPGCEADSCAVS